jgi:FtsZ-interacting cell division protein ZipA
MREYLVFLGGAVFIVPLLILGFWAKRVSEREYQRRKDEGWYI